VSTEDDIGEDVQSTIVVKHPPGNIFNEKWCRGPDSNPHIGTNYEEFKNTNCVTRVIAEDVPPKFYDDKGTIRCRYCRRPYSITSKKVSSTGST